MNLIARLACAIAILMATGCASAPAPGLSGAYRFEDGRIVSIRHSVDNTLRYRMYPSGESKRLYPDKDGVFVAGGFSAKSPVELTARFNVDGHGAAERVHFARVAGETETAMRIGRSEDIVFDSDGAVLAGRLDLPAGDGPHPLIVLVHGSGSDAATLYMYNGDFMMAHGIAVLTFDKRGTGRSEGDYTFDFDQLARDVVAAVRYAKTRTDIDDSRMGVSGYSQGGWVAPLAASISTDIKFVMVSYGLVASPAEEARVETRIQLRGRGVDETSLDELDELTLAAVAIIDSDFKTGWDDFKAIKHKYKDAPWRKQLSGTVIGDFVKYPKWLIRFLGPRRAPKDLDWYYDSQAVLRALDIPMVWLIAGADEMAPPELAVPMIRDLIDTGKPYELAVFEGAEHGMMLFREADGRRVYTGYSGAYLEREVSAALSLVGMNGAP